MTDLSVIVFAFNEAENVPAVLAELVAWLRAHEPSSEVVFVDDGSSDDTAGAAGRALEGFPHRVERHATNRGIGAALKTGVRAARGAWITFMPADGQIEPDAIATLRDGAKNVDVVFSVYEDRDDGLDRKILSAGVRALIRAVHGVTMRSDGPYLVRRRIFDPDDLPPDTFFLNFELPIRTMAAGLPHRIVTIRCRPRLAGSSKSKSLARIVGVAKDLADLRRRRLRRAVKLWRGG
ncbi:MAG: glycosyltransferase family 2 protein [Sandaracinaceae bacterium]|nr:glycosyltransferase family 2 protein [Sandaracinaceae bacterium]